LLETSPDDPSTVRFTHDLIRESIFETATRQRAVRLHLGVADALDDLHAGDEAVAERLAYHLRAAGPLADPARTAAALVRAGRRAGGGIPVGRPPVAAAPGSAWPRRLAGRRRQRRRIGAPGGPPSRRLAEAGRSAAGPRPAGECGPGRD
ncbi:hypothetical protein, partial [Catellatospora coxensis]|uniref:hypothetical protein n=1 Tax=Catellatospora coxensis TaxID=310354 RepID=UPI0031E2ACDD